MIAVDGRAIGTKALATRRRILHHTETLLAQVGVRELKVVDISRAVGASPATFYQYFPDVESALMALFDEVSSELLATVVPLLTPPWTEPSDVRRAHDFVDAYWRVWRSRHAILRIGILRGDEGQERWIDVRQRGYLPMLEALTATVAAAQRARRLARSLDAFSTAACGLSMLIPLMSYTTGPHPEPGLDPLHLDSIVRVLFSSLTGFPA